MKYSAIDDIVALGRADSDFPGVVSTAYEMYSPAETKFAPAALRVATITRHSGLPLARKGAVPDMPVSSWLRLAALGAKRCADVVLTLAGLIVIWPFLLAIVVAIKASSAGPVVFSQERVGKDGKRFRILKFRSMYVDMCDTSGIAHTVRNDPRVTPVGRVLRKTSLDELPQLWNVLRGDMSLVGPRPHVPGMLAAGKAFTDVVPYYNSRHAFRPGLTGWAQVNGFRGEIETFGEARARIDHDISYIQNYSIILDLKILFKTIVLEFITGNGA